MTQREFKRVLDQAVEEAYWLVQASAPVRKGKLKASVKRNATPNGYEIIVTAPHMVFTEEKWVSEQWRGRANPNEGWFREVTELVFRLLRAKLRTSGRYIGSD